MIFQYSRKKSILSDVTHAYDVWQYDLSEEIAPLYRDDLIREITLLKKIGSHMNIVRVIGACTVSEPVALVMEYMPYGNLQEFLRYD